MKKEFVKYTKKDLRDNIDLIVNVKINEAKNLKQTNIEFLEALIKEFNIKLDKKTANKRENMWFNDLEIEIINTLWKRLEENFKKVDDDKLYEIFRDVLLHHLDKLRVDHIDEMQYLRDKVWFMWYAQQDPLIVYKKESFIKFQNLVYMFKSNTTWYILNLDFEAIKKHDEITKLIIEKQKSWDKEFLSKLSKISGNLQELIKLAEQEQNKEKNEIKDKREMIFEDEDGFEVFEIGDEQWETKIEDWKTIENTKIRPNDKVTVKYKDGKMEYSIKYKKVKDDVLAGKCEVIKINEH